MKRALQALAVLLLLAMACLFGLDWRHRPGPSAPRIVSDVSGHGVLRVGAARAAIHIPYPVVPAGYGPKDRHEVWSAAQPQYARAIALDVGGARLTLVSVDLLEIDSRLMSDLKPMLPPDAGTVWVCATHTHSGMGDYDPNLLAQIAGTGRFKKSARDALLLSIVRAVRAATVPQTPSTVAIHSDPVQVIDRSHSHDRPDGRLTTVDFAADAGAHPDIVLRILGAHPTTVPRPASRLDGDFPARLAISNGRVFAAFFQGTVGNVRLAPHHRPFPGIGDAGAPRHAVSALSVTTARVPLPPVVIHVGPSWTRRAAANLVDRLAAPRTAELSIAHLGPLTFIAVPGEPTAAAGRALRRAVGNPHAIVLGLCNGYVGYIESPDRVAKDIGEARRQYFGRGLLARFDQAAAREGRALGLSPR